jgi:hypothetical protein
MAKNKGYKSVNNGPLSSAFDYVKSVLDPFSTPAVRGPTDFY